ncbi:MAG TPA: hypothetical protein VIM71_04285 [Lacunisphaera sp.]
MKKKIVTLVGALVFIAAVHADTATVGATVNLNGTFFTGNDAWSLGTNAAPSDLVDGVYQPTSHQWNHDSVWWNGGQNPGNNIVVDLAGSYLITDLKLQADDNDWYNVEYLGLDLAWHLAWSVSPPGGWGLQTSSFIVGAPFVTSSFRLTAAPGDGYYAISEFEANGRKVSNNVPEGGATVAFFGAIVGLLAIARRKILT